MLNYFPFSESILNCKRAYEGGCTGWETLGLLLREDRAYSVLECYSLCLKDSKCDGFALNKYTWACGTLRKGCKKNPSGTWDFYEIQDCTLGTILLHSYLRRDNVFPHYEYIALYGTNTR